MESTLLMKIFLEFLNFYLGSIIGILAICVVVSDIKKNSDRYKFVKTTNDNLLRLNIRNGEIFIIFPNNKKLLIFERFKKTYKSHSFDLEKTNEMGKFILFDSKTGYSSFISINERKDLYVWNRKTF